MSSCRLEDLRDKAAIGHGRHVAMAIAAGRRGAHNLRFKGVKTQFDPRLVPALRPSIAINAVLAGQMAQNPEIIERMYVAGDQLAERADPRPADRIKRQQWWCGPRLVQILDDGHRLGDQRVVDLQGRHQALGVQLEIVRCVLLSAMIQEMNWNGTPLQSLQLQSDSNSIAGRRAKIAVKPHGGSS